MPIIWLAAGLLAMAPEPVPPARDGNIAIAEELCLARQKGTVEAYELFVARHPQHPLAREARAALARLKAGKAPGRRTRHCPGTE